MTPNKKTWATIRATEKEILQQLAVEHPHASDDELRDLLVLELAKRRAKLALKCDDCGAITVADDFWHADHQGWSAWGPDEHDDRRIWRCGACNDAHLRRARIIEELEDDAQQTSEEG